LVEFKLPLEDFTILVNQAIREQDDPNSGGNAVFSEGGSAIGLDFSTSVALDANWRVWWMVHQPPRFGVYPVDFSGPAHFANFSLGSGVGQGLILVVWIPRKELTVRYSERSAKS